MIKTTQTPEPNLVEIEQILEMDEPALPAHIVDRGEELGLNAQFEWAPLIPYESLEGVLVGSTAMKLGGIAYIFEVDRKGERTQVLLKKGGRIFERCMQHAGQGDRLYIRFLGQLEAKPGQNPARNWKVIRVPDQAI